MKVGSVTAAMRRQFRRVLEMGCLKKEFVFERRGLIDVKGKGPTLTYLLVGRAEVFVSEEAVGKAMTAPTS